MPNHCNNYLTLQGPYDDVKRFFEEAKSAPDSEGKRGEVISFEKHVPMTGPEEGWYQEHIDKWGTKWDAFDSDIHSEDVIKLDSGDGEVQYNLVTAWAPPCNWFASMVPQFPTIEFEMQYEEPGRDCYGVATGSEGVYSDQEMTKEEWLVEMNDEYAAYLKDIEKMSPADLVTFFAGVLDFEDCCQGQEEWSEALQKKHDWNEEMYDFGCLDTHIVKKIAAKDLPLFMNVKWSYSEATKIFKDRLTEGK